MGFSIQTAIQAAFVVSVVLSLGLLQASWRSGRSSFLRYWAAGIGTVALRYLAWMLEPVIGYEMSQFLGEGFHSLSMYLIFFGSARMIGFRLSRYSIGIVILITLGWLFFSTYVRPDFMLRTVPIYLFSSVALLSSAWLFWILRRRHPGTGYGYAFLAALLWGLHKLNYPILRPVPEVAPFGFLLAIGFMTYLSFSLLIIAQNRRRNLLNHLARAAAFNANHDLLTELPNRRFLMSSMVRRSYSEVAFHLVLVDLRNLGQLNDSWGRALADRALVNAARRLDQTLSKRSLLARVGGKQFAIISEDYSLPDLIKAIQQAWRTPLHLDGHRVVLELRIGAATYPEEGATADEIYRNASVALADAKNSGVEARTFGELKTAEVLRRLELKRDLFEALDGGQMHCMYQPQYDIRTGKMVGAEALIRWTHPNFGPVSPAVFIPIAESSGAIVQLGEFVLRSVCADLKQSSLPHDFRISVNLSPVQFSQPDMVAKVQRILEETGVKGNRLEMEITESAIFHDVDFVDQMLRRLGDFGIEFSIDDFGTGYSSFSILRALPVHRLKIDGSFVGGMDESYQDRSIVEMMVYLAHTLQLEVVAEGVEKESQLKILRDIGCDRMQGFLRSPAVPIEALVSMKKQSGEDQPDEGPRDSAS